MNCSLKKGLSISQVLSKIILKCFPDCTGHFFGKLYCPFLFPDTSVLLKLRHHSDLDSYNEELMMYCQVLKRFKHSVLLTYYKKLEEPGIEPGLWGEWSKLWH